MLYFKSNFEPIIWYLLPCLVHSHRASIWMNTAIIVYLFFRHVKEHLDGKIETGSMPISDDEMQFHYFKLHDYDQNNKLDGIELTAAVTHFHKGKSSAYYQDTTSHIVCHLMSWASGGATNCSTHGRLIAPSMLMGQ